MKKSIDHSNNYKFNSMSNSIFNSTSNTFHDSSNNIPRKRLITPSRLLMRGGRVATYLASGLMKGRTAAASLIKYSSGDRKTATEFGRD